MKPIETKEELLDWDEYKKFLKLQLKQIARPETFFVSKEKLVFKQKDKEMWRGHAVLAGPKAPQSIRNLKREQVIFREGNCNKKGRDLTFNGDRVKDRYMREAIKTFNKLKLGYNLEYKEEESPEGS